MTSAWRDFQSNIWLLQLDGTALIMALAVALAMTWDNFSISAFCIFLANAATYFRHLLNCISLQEDMYQELWKLVWQLLGLLIINIQQTVQLRQDTANTNTLKLTYKYFPINKQNVFAFTFWLTLYYTATLWNKLLHKADFDTNRCFSSLQHNLGHSVTHNVIVNLWIQ